jgi:hypothetical protein
MALAKSVANDLELGGKWVDLLKQLRASPYASCFPEAAAMLLGVQLATAPIRAAADVTPSRPKECYRIFIAWA